MIFNLQIFTPHRSLNRLAQRRSATLGTPNTPCGHPAIDGGSKQPHSRARSSSIRVDGAIPFNALSRWPSHTSFHSPVYRCAAAMATGIAGSISLHNLPLTINTPIHSAWKHNALHDGIHVHRRETRVHQLVQCGIISSGLVARPRTICKKDPRWFMAKTSENKYDYANGPYFGAHRPVALSGPARCLSHLL